MIAPTALATDLDGTLIPLEGNSANVSDLSRLREALELQGRTLVFVTGRHFESVLKAIDDHRLPAPDWIICDVGTTVYQADDAVGFRSVRAYSDRLEQTVATFPMRELRSMLESVPGAKIQEAEKLGPYKLSFYTDAKRLKVTSTLIASAIKGRPWSIVSSIDPFNGDGLIDVLPTGVSKAFALSWWSRFVGASNEAIIFAGDSGNDLAALTAGYRGILVGNASEKVRDDVVRSLESEGRIDRLYQSTAPATSGVLEGCLAHNLISQP